MKVYLYGNILNNSYNLTKFLRAKGVDAEMFLDDASALGQDYPWWEDANLSPDNLPDWIHYYKIKPDFLFPQSGLKKMISDFSKCDIGLVCGWGPIIASRAKIPYFYYSHGSDLNITDFAENITGALRKILLLKKPNGFRSFVKFARIQKKAIMNADRIGILMGYQVNPYIKKYGLLSKMKKIRLAWDIEKYKVVRNETLTEKYKQYDIVFFMLARHIWKSVWNDFIKGNDKFLRAFARFVKDKKPNVRLVMIEKGEDLEESKKIISSYGIQNYVEWVKEMNKDGIRAYNSLDNVVVVDQFWHDRWFVRYPEDKAKPRIGFGSAGIEALCAEKPLITVFFDEDFYEGNHPPILSAFTEDEIYSRLVESLEMGSEKRKVLGRKGYEFVKKYHGWENTIDQYISILKEILEEKEKKKISPVSVHA